MAAVELDSRILDFRNPQISLPALFDKSKVHNMMLACGDGIKDTKKRNM
jgi:hypothetical protein